MAGVVSPVLHKYVPPPVAVSVAEAPAHIVPSLFTVPEASVTVIVGIGAGVTVIVVDNISTQAPLVKVTLYNVVMTGVTTMAAVVSPVLHRYVPPPAAVIVADAPAHMIP